ncbi:MAG: hypothetical protein M1814_004840 [Vezdaea aestivalis]|nr:MAG: hypothetical protein M1814_004840 [Vezdaea aestivalis]
MYPNVARLPQVWRPSFDPQSLQNQHFQRRQSQPQANYEYAQSLPVSPVEGSPLDHGGSISHDHSLNDQSRQYTALPLQRSGSFSAHPYSNHGPDPSEHMLRRKTPNGTLSAAYDGTPVEWASQQHAMKHILLPLPPSSAQVQNPATNTDGFDYLNQAPVPIADAPTFQYAQPRQSVNQALPGQGGGFGYDSQSNGMIISPNQALGIDSMLNQAPLQQPQAFYVHGGMQIPTALQPSIHTFPGPTASNEGGPYGPYWPNGVYIPYRPAAIQDIRFNAENWGSLPGQLPHFPNFSSHIPSLEGDYALASQGKLSASNTDLQLQMGLQGFGPSTFNNPFIQQSYHDQLERPQTAIRLHSSHGASLPQLTPLPSPAHYSYNHININPIPQQMSHAENEKLKEKVLSWAHSVYVNLLLSIHHSKRHDQSNGQGNNAHQVPRASIYPKPPRQPGSQFAYDADLSNQRSRLQVKGSNTAHLPHSSNSSIGPHQDQIGHPVASNDLHGLESDPTRTLRRPSGNIVASSHAVQQQEMSRRTDAKKALDKLTELCQKSDWRWIDGLLLGGCLAYGLADYTHAMTWYMKILELDKNHVEATSNLAATLLSLNRRDEAERYWLLAVKLRPSYFEAVEHLIGLLCGGHRGKEAVSIIEFVEKSLRISDHGGIFKPSDCFSESESETSRASSATASESEEYISYDYEPEEFGNVSNHRPSFSHGRFGTSGYAIPSSENGRILALVHAKGNMMYALGNNAGAAKAFEDAILIVCGRRSLGISGLISRILSVVSGEGPAQRSAGRPSSRQDPVLLPPEKALQTAKLLFPSQGELPGLIEVREPMAKKAAISTTSNSLLSLAKIFQDGMASSTGDSTVPRPTSGVRDILALYYLSLSLQPSPSTANNVGILLASVQQTSASKALTVSTTDPPLGIPGVVPGSGVALALAYYDYGLKIDPKHAHLYTNLGSLLKDIGHLSSAIKMYEHAVSWDGNFDIALANLANAVKDQGRVSDAINFYKRAVVVSPEFPEAVCGLANALNSVCNWAGRGGVKFSCGKRDRWHVDEKGMLSDSRMAATGQGWMKRVVEIVEKQLRDGELWGKGTLTEDAVQKLVSYVERSDSGKMSTERRKSLEATFRSWSGKPYEGAKIVRLIERLVKRLTWRWYQDLFVLKQKHRPDLYARPRFPASLSIPSAPTVLPFHTFTCPLTAKQIRSISQRNGLRISCTSLKSPWLHNTAFKPPSPPSPVLNVGYVSSDFNNHPLAHLMQSVFGFHDPKKVKAFSYATTASDNSVHRKQIEKESPVFHDASSWSADRLVKQILADEIHILINLNGYTRGARNEVFAARAVPIQMSFMGFAGTLGSEWCDYILADNTAIPLSTLRPWRRNIDADDQFRDDNLGLEESDWVYSENIVFAKDTFFCCDHRQSAPDSQGKQLTWDEEQARRWEMRKELFPSVSDDAIILGNFNQLYKIEPTTFRTWLRILSRLPNAILWLLRFPELGESHLKETAKLWAGPEVAARIIFTDVAPKHQHISRARICDIFLDTPECNAHTTAADVLWSGTPLLTLPRYGYKMCSRMAASILKGALPAGGEGKRAAKELIAAGENEYEDMAVKLGSGLVYPEGAAGRGKGRLMELRKMLYQGRWSSALFDTRRWVADLETAYEIAWKKWVAGEGGDIWL